MHHPSEAVSVVVSEEALEDRVKEEVVNEPHKEAETSVYTNDSTLKHMYP